MSVGSDGRLGGAGRPRALASTPWTPLVPTPLPCLTLRPCPTALPDPRAGVWWDDQLKGLEEVVKRIPSGQRGPAGGSLHLAPGPQLVAMGQKPTSHRLAWGPLACLQQCLDTPLWPALFWQEPVQAPGWILATPQAPCSLLGSGSEEPTKSTPPPLPTHVGMHPHGAHRPLPLPAESGISGAGPGASRPSSEGGRHRASVPTCLSLQVGSAALGGLSLQARKVPHPRAGQPLAWLSSRHTATWAGTCWALPSI